MRLRPSIVALTPQRCVLMRSNRNTERRIVADRGDGGRRLDLVLRAHLADLPGRDAHARAGLDRGRRGDRQRPGGPPHRRPRARRATSSRSSCQRRLVAPRPRDARPRSWRSTSSSRTNTSSRSTSRRASSSIPTYRHADGTVMNALLWRARGWRASDRPSIVGRLDKLTSGIVIAAKSARAHAAIQRALAGDCGRQAISRARLRPRRRGARNHRPASPPRSARSPARRGVGDGRGAERHAIRAARTRSAPRRSAWRSWSAGS